MNKLSHKQQRGLSLIELMISTAIGMIIIGAATSVYIATLKSSSTALKNSKLNQELTTLMTVTSNDIRRAGFDFGLDTSAPQTNAFSQVGDTALTVRDDKDDDTDEGIGPTANAGECILYSYDLSNPTQAANDVDNNELFGFRLNTATGAVEMRRLVDNAAAILGNTEEDSCDDAGHNWETVTDSNLIEVTRLDFNLSTSTCLNVTKKDGADNDGDTNIDEDDEINCYNAGTTISTGDITVETREVDITLEGRLVNDTSVQATLNNIVRVRNDLIRIR